MEGHLHFGALILLLAAASGASAEAADPDQLLTRADHLAGIGNLDAARPLYTQAEQEFHARGDTRNELYAKFGRLRRDVESGSYSFVAAEVAKDLQNPVVQNDPALKIRALSLKGVIDLNLNTGAAQDDFSQILALAKSIGDRKWENRASGELGIVAGVNGDERTAAAALLQAITTAAALNDVEAQITFNTWIANGMTVQGMADGAIQFLDRALGLVSKEPDAGFPIQLYIAKIRALVAVGGAGGASRGAEVQRLIESSLKYARENEILGAQCELLNQAGLLALREHDLKAAENDFQQNVAVAERAHLPRMEAEGFLNLSEVYQQRKELARAAAALDSAIVQVRQVQQDLDLPVYLARKAEIEAGRGNLRDADLLYDQASEMIEAMLINTPTSRHKVSMIAALSDIYVGHFRLAVSELHDNAKAFRIIETARARTLADSIRYARQSPASAGTSAAEQQIAAIQKHLRDSPVSPAETKVLLAKLDKLYDEQLPPVEYARSRAEMRITRRPPISIPTLQRSLAPGEVLIEYVLDNSASSHALEITRTMVRVHPIPTRAEVNDLCQKYLSAVQTKGNWQEPARDLFERVVRPAVSEHASSVVIVPDGPLNLIPFVALPDRNGELFGRSAIVSLAPSATVFEMLRTARRDIEPTKPFLGIAYSSGIPAGSVAPNSASRSLQSAFTKLQPLQFARDEVEAASRVAGSASVVLVDGAATESALKAQRLADFMVIHLAMHGFGDPVDPDRAGLVLAPGDPKEDGLWQAREIQETRLAADLVTLSACETGAGKLQGEEGIMNLARTFLVAGAKSVVASLWDADDRATATLMTHFYQQIAAGKTVAGALRDAQLGMLTEFGSDMPPYFWAGFTVIGDGDKKINFAKTKPAVGEAANASIR